MISLHNLGSASYPISKKLNIEMNPNDTKLHGKINSKQTR